MTATATVDVIDPRRRVLVVDDSRDAAYSLAAVLSQLGYAAHGAVGGIEAIDKATELRPEIVFLDLAMPMMDGIDTAQRLRQIPGLESVILVALTGWNRDEDFMRTREAGFHKHLVKPVPIEEILQVLENCPWERQIT